MMNRWWGIDKNKDDDDDEVYHELVEEFREEAEKDGEGRPSFIKNYKKFQV